MKVDSLMEIFKRLILNEEIVLNCYSRGFRESRAFDAFTRTFLSTWAKNYFFRGRDINFYFMQS